MKISFSIWYCEKHMVDVDFLVVGTNIPVCEKCGYNTDNVILTVREHEIL